MSNRPTKDEALQAVRTMIAYTGDNPIREGLLDTPKRVVQAWEELFSGYKEDPAKELSRTFEEVEGYDDIVLLQNIGFESHCEHHIMPFIGKAHVAYLPDNRVVGISKLARVVEIFARRLQTQEMMTVQIANAIQSALQPKGVAVQIRAEHSCMGTRGVRKAGVMTVTNHYMGAFKDQPSYREELRALLANH